MSVLYDFHKVKQLLTIEHLHAEVIQYEQVSLCELGKEPVQGAYSGRYPFTNSGDIRSVRPDFITFLRQHIAESENQ